MGKPGTAVPGKAKVGEAGSALADDTSFVMAANGPGLMFNKRTGSPRSDVRHTTIHS